MQIDKETQQNIRHFIKSLTGTRAADIQRNIAEILAAEKFHDSIAKRGDDGTGTKPFSLKISMDVTSCLAMYTLCRTLKPSVVVETGVASGVSTSYMLLALHNNNHGKLYSIDVPWYTVTGNWKNLPAEDLKVRPIEKRSGWIIPDDLRDRWKLLVGKSQEKLPALLKKIGPVDVFFHDSEHSYENMSREFRTIWPSLKIGGMIVAHNVDQNKAFPDFEASVEGKSFRLSGKNLTGHQMFTGAMIKI